MEKKNENIPAESSGRDQSWRSAPFDAVTNFSLLGWILDKFGKRKKAEKIIDLKLDE